MKLRAMKLMLALLALVGGAEVQAQYAPHVCGAGPGPDEVLVGVQPGGNGIAPTPLCYWKQDRQSEQPPDHACGIECSMMNLDYIEPTPVGSGVWASVATTHRGQIAESGNYSRPENAIADAMEECQEEMQEEGIEIPEGQCTLRITFDNGFAAIVKDEVDSSKFFVAHGQTRDLAKAEATRLCRQAAKNCSAKAYIVRNDGNVDSIY